MTIDELQAGLRAAASPGGGWAYYRGKQSRIEPTAWALLALDDPGEAHLDFLHRQVGAGGLLLDPGTTEVNYGWNGLALVALQARQADAAEPLRQSIQAGLVAAKGVQLSNDGPRVVAQDGQLQAWSWTAGTFSWIEPTAYCMLALKQVPSPSDAVRARLDEAERVLLDRACPEGGWNYGNSAVLGQDLRAYVPTTALGVLAMQDRREAPAVKESLAWLEAHALSERSAMALSLAAIALAVYGRPVAPVLQALDAQFQASGFLGNAHLMAMALYALTMDRHGARHFRVSQAAVGAPA